MQETNQQEIKKTDFQNQKLHLVEYHACGSGNDIMKDCKKKYGIFVSYKEGEV